MARKEALQTKMARAIARKSGIRRGSGLASTVSQTLVDVWVYPKADKENWQWDVDLTGFTAIRFVNRGPFNPNFFLAYSLDTSTTLAPSDYQLFPTLFPADPYGYPTQWLEAFSGNSELDGGYPWAEIREDLRVPMRLSFSLGTGGGTNWNWDIAPLGWGSDNYGGGFSVGVQVRA
jgi:hypothetical protein